MPHETPLISTIVAALVLAFVLGAIANRLRISPLVGYLLAGVAIGPFTPGYVADQGPANRAGLSRMETMAVVGHGRVGRIVAGGLKTRQVPLFLIESDDANVAKLTAAGFEAIAGNAADPDVINAANIGGARCLMVAIPDAFEGGQVVAQARATNPGLPIIARSHSDEETVHLKAHGATRVIMGEEEIALAMLAELARL